MRCLGADLMNAGSCLLLTDSALPERSLGPKLQHLGLVGTFQQSGPASAERWFESVHMRMHALRIAPCGDEALEVRLKHTCL